MVLTNGAFRTLFRGVGPHPTAMPADNFLRFVLFHPDASAVLGEHESSWCLPMLAHFAATLERHGRDPVLQAVRRDIAQDPIMEAAYRQGLPHWIRAVGAEAVEHDGAVRPLHHPDPRWGTTECRIVVETPKSLAELGFTRWTLVLREPRRTPSAPPAPAARRPICGWSRPLLGEQRVPVVRLALDHLGLAGAAGALGAGVQPFDADADGEGGGGNAASVRRKDAARPRVSVPVPCAPSPAAAGTPARTGGTARRRTRGRARSAPGP